MSVELMFWLTNVAWMAIALGCGVWGFNAIALAVIRRRRFGTPIFGSLNPWAWTWSTCHGLKDVALFLVAGHVLLIRLGNGPGTTDSVPILIVRLTAAAILWLCIARWSVQQFGDVQRPDAGGPTP